MIAQLIARMAVDHRHRRKRLGEFLLMYALNCCLEIRTMSAFPVVIVDAKDEAVKPFYTKYGFTPFPDKPLRLYLPIDTVRKLLE